MTIQVVCRRCGARSSIVRHRAGSVWLEVLLWLAFVTPGFVYHMWRHRHNYYLCRECGKKAATYAGIATAHRPM